MSVLVEVPLLGESLTEAIIAEWLIKEGDFVEKDEMIARLDTDKISVEVTAPVTGTIMSLKFSVDQSVKPGDVIAEIGDGEVTVPPTPVSRTGQAMSMHQSVAFKLMQKCGDCGSNFPINGMVEQYDCAHCGREYEMDLREWRRCFGDEFSRGAGRNGANGIDMTIICQGIHFRFHSRQILPQCPECDAEVPVDGLEPDSVDLPCPKCDYLLPVRRATDLARGLQQRALYLVGEYGIEDHIRKMERKVEPVMFSCLQCGAGLSVDGTSRSVSCQYCDASNYLPEGLWRKLNPVPTAEYFYFILESRRARYVRKRREKEQEEERRRTDQIPRDVQSE